MNFKLVIHEGTDSIKFGMTSEEIQSILKIKPELIREKFGLYDYEIYKGICCVYYEKKQNTMVTASFEINEPSKVYLDGFQVIGLTEKNTIELFSKHFYDFVSDPPYGTSDKYDILIGFPDGKLRSVNIARKGYMIEEDERLDKAYEEEEAKESTTIKKYKCYSCSKIIKSIDRPGCPKCHVPMMRWK